MSDPNNALEVRDLSVTYSRGSRTPAPKAVDGVSFDIASGKTLGLVGESGSGKSTIAKAILHLAPIGGGTIDLYGRDITEISSRERPELASLMQVVFQDPFSTFNPSRTIGQSLMEMLRPQGKSNAEAQDRAESLLISVGIPSSAMSRFPSEFSGGQRQRIAVARALMVDTRLLICDEAVSSLDLSVKAQVINLLRDFQRERDLSILFISHDLAIVRHIAQEVVVLYKGKVMEFGQSLTLFNQPLHPYTRLLIDAAPVPNPEVQRNRRILRAPRVATEELSEGCPFAPRCPFATDRCRVEVPQLTVGVNGSMVACHNWQEALALSGDSSETVDERLTSQARIT
jgi:peptide/nickel transport system ATP-binding protein